MILPEFFDACDHCGEPFERATTYPVLTNTDETGGMKLYSFCDDECLSAWRDAGEPGDEAEGNGAQA